MEKIVFLLLFISFGVASCKKDGTCSCYTIYSSHNQWSSQQKGTKEDCQRQEDFYNSMDNPSGDTIICNFK